MKLSCTVLGTGLVATCPLVPGWPPRAAIATMASRTTSPAASPAALRVRSIRNVVKNRFVEERRSGGDRRCGGDRRQDGTPKRGQDRRKSGDRRSGGERRSGRDRRDS